jgi:hypothetical protein
MLSVLKQYNSPVNITEYASNIDFSREEITNRHCDFRLSHSDYNNYATGFSCLGMQEKNFKIV